MTSVRVRERPYTSPLIKNPTYPTVVNGYVIRELEWQEELKIYSLIWIPSQSELTLVRARTPEEAISMAPPPWRKYPQDIRAVEELR